MESESIETRGRTVDEAIRTALEQLGVTRDEVDVEILAEGRAGVFGVGSQEARVRVTILSDEDYDEDEDEEEPAYVGTYARPTYEDEEEEEDEEEAEEAEQPAHLADEQADLARDTLERMLDLLEFPNVVTIRGIERDRGMVNIRIDVAGDDVGLLIGRHGETLASLQFILNACLNRELPRGTRVVVDVEHYRDRREQSLRGIALRAADRVRRERRSMTLQPMPPNERRIIHLTLQSSPWVTTESTGEGDERRVVVSPKQTAPPRRPSYGGYRRG
jgi:spoIIIJ-associated protein